MTENKIEIKSEYNLLREKFGDLPEFEILNKEFELEFIDKLPFLLRQIRRKINEKVVFFCKVVETILYPTLQTAISGYESRFFSDEEKNKIEILHKKLMNLERVSLSLEVTSEDNENEVLYIKNVFSQWEDFKKEMTFIANKMTSSWKEELNEKEEGYFG